MKKPPSEVIQSVLIIWVLLAVTCVISVVQKLIGDITVSQFFIDLIIIALSCVFPYKILKGSNSARYLYSILTVISYLPYFAGVVPNVSNIQLVAVVALSPFSLYSVYLLFKGDVNSWFEGWED